MEKNSWLDKATNEQVLTRVGKWKRANTELYLAKETSMADFYMKLLTAEWEVKQQEGEDEFKCYTIWQMMVVFLHSNGQLRTQRDVKKLLYRRELYLSELIYPAQRCC